MPGLMLVSGHDDLLHADGSALAVTGVEVMAVDVPRRATFGLQRGETPPSSPFTIVRLSTDAGLVGWGEGCTTVRGLASVASENLRDLLVSSNPLDINAVHDAIDDVEMMRVERLGHWNVLRAAVDMAMWDLRGKWFGVPVHTLLGGARRSTIDVVKNVGVDDATCSAERARELVGEGYTVVKVRVGGDLALDLARLEAIRDAVGPDVRIRIDANQAWSPSEAVAAIRLLGRVGLESVESPCAGWDVAGSAEVVSKVDVPIIADEAFWTLGEARTVLAARAADALHVYLGKCGGITAAAKIAALAEAFAAEVTVGERVPLGIAEAAHLQFAATLPSVRLPCALAYDLNEHSLLIDGIERQPGAMKVPSRPGLGVEVDEDMVAFYRVA